MAAFAAEFLVHRVLPKLTRKTETELDDRVVRRLRRPVFFTVIIVGGYWATMELREHLSVAAHGFSRSLVYTLAILLWAGTVVQIGSMLLRALSKRASEGSLVQPSSLPLFDILLKLMVVASAIYFGFLAWRIDVTAWLASAGIVGVAVGFGAKDTMSNLFAGIFIIADAPYRVGDYVVLEDNVRGRVTNIGMRSTRILTLDLIEITIPNGVIGAGPIVNEAGGPDLRQRLHVDVAVAYGSDVDLSKQVLLSCAEDVKDVCAKPAPEAHFVKFGDSGLHFKLLAWVCTTFRARAGTRYPSHARLQGAQRRGHRDSVQHPRCSHQARGGDS